MNMPIPATEYERGRQDEQRENACKYAPPAIEVIDGVITDRSQDADWLRARYFERVARIEELEAGVCRFNCRTAKQSWIEGYVAAWRLIDPDDHEDDLRLEAEEQYDEWKGRQTENT